MSDERTQEIIVAQSDVNMRIERLCEAKVAEERARVRVIEASIELDDAKYKLQQAYERKV